MFGFELDSWELITHVSLGIAAIGAIALLVSTIIVNKLQKLEAKDKADAFLQYTVDAGVKIAEATEGAAKAKARGDEAKAEAAKANEASAKANTRTREAQLEIAKIQESLKDRGLTGEQYLELISHLKSQTFDNLVMVEWKLLDKEAEGYARQLADALEHANVKIFIVGAKADINPGLNIGGTGQHDIANLNISFRVSKIPFGFDDGHNEVGNAVLMIGQKPSYLSKYDPIH